MDLWLFSGTKLRTKFDTIITPLFLYWKNNSDSVNENINRLLEDSKVFLDKRRSKKKESKWDYFNIFSAISDTYKKENYCSDILKLILDPNTDEIGNPKYLYEFLLFIGISEKEIKKCFNVSASRKSPLRDRLK